jgi:hypothetical protein
MTSHTSRAHRGASNTMKTCNTCRYWIKPDNHNEICHPYDWATQAEMVMPFEVRKCMHPDLRFCERPLAEHEASVRDGSYYMAELCTGPKFGCTSHQGIEGTQV